jgi:hypothetical protein
MLHQSRKRMIVNRGSLERKGKDKYNSSNCFLSLGYISSITSGKFLNSSFTRSHKARKQEVGDRLVGGLTIKKFHQRSRTN